MIAALPAFAMGLVAVLADVNVAGSIFINQPTLLNPVEAGEEQSVLGATNRGLNAEANFKIVADVTEQVSASAKVCFGCHGFMADMAYFDWNVAEPFNVRAGRFPVPFGEFYLRHDPANHRSSSKPLPYSMGRMLHREAYNLAVLPEPYPDNGVELFGTFRAAVAELSYSLYAVAGLKGSEAAGDLDFIRSRTEYFTDNNRTPTVGARLTLAFPNLPVERWRWFAIGASGLYGNYDDDDRLSYALVGLDLYTRYDRVNLRGEVMMRRTEIPDRPERYQQRLEDLFVQREGFYVELDGPLGGWLEWLARVDGFRRAGPLLLGAPLVDTRSSIVRYTAGLNLIPTTAVKLKVNYEYWRFTDFSPAHLLHSGLVGTF